MCLMSCEYGFKRDTNGCTICECATQRCPSIVQCADDCGTDGYHVDDDGCQTCECASRRPAVPPNILAFVIVILVIALVFIILSAILVSVICYKTRRSRFYNMSEANSHLSFDNDGFAKKLPPTDAKSTELQKVSLA